MVEWETATLDEVSINLVRGPFGGSLKKEIFVSSGYKVYEQQDAIYGKTAITRYFITFDKYNELIRFAIADGDFIVSCSGTIGRIYRLPKNSPRGVINQALLKITLNEKEIVPDFFLQYFRWDNFQQTIIDDTQGGAMKNLVGMDKFKLTEIPKPPLPEQHRIAAVLSDTDELITTLEKLITKKKAIKQGAMQELLTGKRRLEGFSGEWVNMNLVANSTLKARIGWQGLTTAEYLDNGYSYLVTGTDFINGKIAWETCHYVDEYRYNQDRNIQIRNGDILITKDGTIGKVAIVSELIKKATLNSGVFVIRSKSEVYDHKFVYYVLLSQIFIDFLDKLAAGSTINHLYQKDFINFEFNVPPTLKEQTAIAESLSDMDLEINKLTAKLNKYRQIKQGMMSELLTGRIRLTEDVQNG